MKDLLQKFRAGDVRSLGRLITMVENKMPGTEKILKDINPLRGKSYIIGLTGPPGAGKSTLTGKIIRLLRNQGPTVGVICVDPTSPFTGGALLGDRVRMLDTVNDPDVYIRSLASRGGLGGLSPMTKEVVQVLDAFGKDYIIIETVGAGQLEADIIDIADTVIVLTIPGLGDSIQTIKAGIMEIADIFVVNMADREGTRDTIRDLKNTIERVMPEGSWTPPIIPTVATHGEGINELFEQILLHRKYLEESELLNKRREKRDETLSLEIVDNLLYDYVKDKMKNDHNVTTIIEQVRKKDMDPYSGAKKIVNNLFGEKVLHN